MQPSNAQMADFMCALTGAKGELDAWLEVNSEAEVKAHILTVMSFAVEGAKNARKNKPNIVKSIDYEKLIEDCFTRTGHRQGTSFCVQFARGAEWMREQILQDNT